MWMVQCTSAIKDELTLYKTYKILKVLTQDKTNKYLIENDKGEEAEYASKKFTLNNQQSEKLEV
jgi:hypothetical protein